MDQPHLSMARDSNRSFPLMDQQSQSSCSALVNIQYMQAFCVSQVA
jgi:hypothetical protein